MFVCNVFKFDFFIFQGKLVLLIRVIVWKKIIINASRKLKEMLHLRTNFFLNGYLNIGMEGVYIHTYTYVCVLMV